MINRLYVLTFLIVLGFAALAQTQTFTTLYNFTGGPDGAGPLAGVIQDSVGNLYGTTGWGGSSDWGVAYELNTVGTESVLHSFSGNPDGGQPVTPVIRDKAGGIYGTTAWGGSSFNGTVFKIDTAGNETVLYNFTGRPDGCDLQQGLVRDKAGNLYGTAEECGPYGWGTIFKVNSAGKFTLLHSFTKSDGGYPANGHLTLDNAGNLYGVTYLGGSHPCDLGFGCGVLYELSKTGKFTVLHSFAGGSDGCNPFGALAQDNAGNLYGTTASIDCGSANYGTIWKVSREGKETILHHFAGGTLDGCNPYAGVARDAKGNLYGVTWQCGANLYYGALYKLSVKGRLTLLHSFDGSDGIWPSGEVWRTTKGTLFGTTYSGGTYDNGTVWSYVP
jgi:uncharacterized repeat protein (TIGR03803 family)